MIKYFRSLLIFCVAYTQLFQFALASDANCVLKSFEKCSVQNDCSDVLSTVKKINNRDSGEIVNLENLIPKSITEEPSVTEINTVDYKLPEEVYKLPEGFIYTENTSYISNIDPRSGEKGVNIYYPGLRGANQLMVYTPSFGLRTGTNEYGAEAVVVKNMVVKLTGADSIIPKEGFVISGHGRAKKWIQDNIILGAKIYINPETMTITSYITPDTYVFEAQEKIKETFQVVEYYKMMDKSYDARKSMNLLNKANDYIKKAEKHADKSHYYLSLAKEQINLALNYAIPYKNDEFRGIWIRPVEHSEKEIENTVEILKNAGINNVILETFYHGTTIYPSEVLAKYGVISQRGEFNTFDPLEVWTRLCKENNIKLHIWFQSYYIGNQPPRSSDKHILSVYPSWANTTKELAESSEIAYSKAEHDGYFLDPANPEVQLFLQELLTEIVEKYRPDGINLDYIRYPLSSILKTDASQGTEWGYTQYARKEFNDLYSVDPLQLKVSDDLRNNWFEYKQKKITDFVEYTRKLTRKNNIMLTAVIFTDSDKALSTKMQDWTTWSKRHLVDGFTPLLLTTDKRTAGALIRDIKSHTSSSTKLFPGIFVMYMNAPSDQLMLQIHETRKTHADGLILFDYAHFTNEYQEAVSTRAFSKKRW